MQAFHEQLREMSDQVCIHPQLPLYDSTVSQFFHDIPGTTCVTEENWVYVENGTFRISKHAKRKHRDIHCRYVPILRGNSDYKVVNGKVIDPMVDGAKLESDFFKVACDSAAGKRYFNIHSGISPSKNIRKMKLPNNSMGLNVLMFGFDSVSRMTWMRKLPKSHKYFIEEMGGMVLEGYNIVGDGTPQALLPLLTGKHEAELPESRVGKPGAKPLDGHPWIWKDFQEAGYVTQWAEDMAHIGTFNYRMLGFQQQPVHHYMRPYFLSAEKLYPYNKPFCMGSVPRHKNLMNWIRDLFIMYEKTPKFTFGFHSEYSHTNSNQLQAADDDFKEFLTFLNSGEYLKNTILILMSDHGARFHEIRKTVQGKLEERMPYFAFRFPQWFEEKYPKAFYNFKTNIRRLTTPFDIHETFHDIINSSGSLSQPGIPGISLFNEIPKERSCKDAAIAPHWCACLQWRDVELTDPNVSLAVQEVVRTINELTFPFRSDCELLRLEKITRSVVYRPRKEVLKFKNSVDTDGRIADLTDMMSLEHLLYQVTFYTDPCSGHFESTVKYNLQNNTFDVSSREISRINKYGSAPQCIVDKSPDLRPYCCCKNQ